MVDVAVVITLFYLSQFYTRFSHCCRLPLSLYIRARHQTTQKRIHWASQPTSSSTPICLTHSKSHTPKHQSWRSDFNPKRGEQQRRFPPSMNSESNVDPPTQPRTEREITDRSHHTLKLPLSLHDCTTTAPVQSTPLYMNLFLVFSRNHGCFFTLHASFPSATASPAPRSIFSKQCTLSSSTSSLVSLCLLPAVLRIDVPL